MGHGTHDYVDDPRNKDILININGELFSREEAKVSVFDSGYILGDGVWEGLRLHEGVLVFLDRHIKRLFDGAKALDMDLNLSKEDLKKRLYDTLDANQMKDHVHIRLMVTRGIKATPYQDPRITITPPTIVIIPEYKTPVQTTIDAGMRLFTVHVRRGYPDVQDPKLNTHSKLNCITACIQAAKAGADEALMLDPHGFVATCNSTHFFIVRNGELWTSKGTYCLDGITRGTVIEIAREAGIPVYERDFSLSDVYGADEAFVTGTYAGLAPVRDVDGRQIGEEEAPMPGPMVERLRKLYRERIAKDVAAGRGD